MKAEGRRPRILICDAIADRGVELLKQHGRVDILTGLKPDELLNMIDRYDAIVVQSQTRITAAIINQGHNLKVIGQAGSGLDNIDVIAANGRGIKVVNCPDANTRAVAEHTMALLLGLARQLPRADLTMKAGKWKKNKLLGTGLFGKTLGIIGFGRIGREVAKRAQGFGMKILVNQSRPTPELNLEGQIEPVDLIELLHDSDFVTLHVPAKAETFHLIGAKELAVMKPTAYLLNTARGSVIDENDLLDALNNSVIAGAALDVFAKEPAINSALAQHERVIASPHIGASTEDAQNLAAETVARQIIDIIQDVPVENSLSLKVVPAERVYLHENTDERRVTDLARRLTEDGILSNPPVVVESDDHYVVLDGATRVTAFKTLRIPHVIVQLVSPQAGVNLQTWFHAIRNIDPAQLLKVLDEIPEISVRSTDSQHVLNEMFDYGGICHIRTVDDRFFLVCPAPEVNHLQALNRLTETYIDASHVSRTLDDDIASLREEYPDFSALVIFPKYTVEQILQIAAAGQAVPAGITRFIIPGRVLRINMDLEFLKSDASLLEKNMRLRQFVNDKLGKGEVRYYAEPVYLLDE